MTKQLLVFAMMMLFAACGGEDKPSGPPVSKPSCEARCKSKLTGCGLPSSDANQVCPQICGAGLTESQVTCLENLPCDTDPEDAASECDIDTGE